MSIKIKVSQMTNNRVDFINIQLIINTKREQRELDMELNKMGSMSLLWLARKLQLHTKQYKKLLWKGVHTSSSPPQHSTGLLGVAGGCALPKRPVSLTTGCTYQKPMKVWEVECSFRKCPWLQPGGTKKLSFSFCPMTHIHTVHLTVLSMAVWTQQPCGLSSCMAHSHADSTCRVQEGA